MDGYYTANDCRSFFRLVREVKPLYDHSPLISAIQKEYFRVGQTLFGDFLKRLKSLSKSEFMSVMGDVSEDRIESQLELVEALGAVLPQSDVYSTFLSQSGYSIINILLKALCPKRFAPVRAFCCDEAGAMGADLLNKFFVNKEWEFKALSSGKSSIDFQSMKETMDLFTKSYRGEFWMGDLVVYPFCERIAKFHPVFQSIPKGQLIALQSNNYIANRDHVNCVFSLDEFFQQAPMSTVLYGNRTCGSKYETYTLVGVR